MAKVKFKKQKWNNLVSVMRRSDIPSCNPVKIMTMADSKGFLRTNTGIFKSELNWIQHRLCLITQCTYKQC